MNDIYSPCPVGLAFGTGAPIIMPGAPPVPGPSDQAVDRNAIRIAMMHSHLHPSRFRRKWIKHNLPLASSPVLDTITCLGTART